MLPVAADGTCRAPESSAKTNRMKQHAKRVIAFYLPQYHPFPENDRWWGAGFTEWRNVVKARPLFRGHYQPHLPADLGFYDLRVPEVRQQQAALAERYGLSGFCYYHYWFNGHRLMQRPVEEMLASGKPDFPFMLCWANENWTRAWDGGEQEVLIRQEYSEEDDRAHIRYLLDEAISVSTENRSSPSTVRRSSPTSGARSRCGARRRPPAARNSISAAWRVSTPPDAKSWRSDSMLRSSSSPSLLR